MKILKRYLGIGAVYSLMKFVAAFIKRREALQDCYREAAEGIGNKWIPSLLTVAFAVFIAVTWPIWLISVDIV